MYRTLPLTLTLVFAAIVCTIGTPSTQPSTQPSTPPAGPPVGPSAPTGPPGKCTDPECQFCAAPPFKTRCNGLVPGEECNPKKNTFDIRMMVYTKPPTGTPEAKVLVFCPLVDKFVAVMTKGALGVTSWFTDKESDIYIRMFASDVYKQQPYTENTTQVIDFGSYLGEEFPYMLRRSRSDGGCNGNMTWVATSPIIFNITMKDGLFQRATVDTDESDLKYIIKAKTGFAETCNTKGCIFDVLKTGSCAKTGKWRKNGFCGNCEVPDKTNTTSPVVFLAWAGTDSEGHPMTSGNKNPLTFQQYSINGVFDVMIQAVAQVKEKAIAVADWTQDAASKVGKAVGSVYKDIEKGVKKVTGTDDKSGDAPSSSL